MASNVCMLLYIFRQISIQTEMVGGKLRIIMHSDLFAFFVTKADTLGVIVLEYMKKGVGPFLSDC